MAIRTTSMRFDVTSRNKASRSPVPDTAGRAPAPLPRDGRVAACLGEIATERIDVSQTAFGADGDHRRGDVRGRKAVGAFGVGFGVVDGILKDLGIEVDRIVGTHAREIIRKSEEVRVEGLEERLAQVLARVDLHARAEHLVVEVRPGRASGRTDVADQIAALHALAGVTTMRLRCP
jgi:hypothetical protein